MDKRSIFLFLGCLFLTSVVQAQVVDMRAYSRQKGFKAYKAAPPPAPVRRASVQRQQEQPPAAEEKTCTDGTCLNQEISKPPQVNQTGVKVFQEKDEDKILNFNVENPEFDKLSDRKKEDVMKRIVFEEK